MDSGNTYDSHQGREAKDAVDHSGSDHRSWDHGRRIWDFLGYLSTVSESH